MVNKLPKILIVDDEPQILRFLRAGRIRHFWGSELSFAPSAPNQHHRSGDATSALWGLLDMTPARRGQFFPKIRYD